MGLISSLPHSHWPHVRRSPSFLEYTIFFFCSLLVEYKSLLCWCSFFINLSKNIFWEEQKKNKKKISESKMKAWRGKGWLKRMKENRDLNKPYFKQVNRPLLLEMHALATFTSRPGQLYIYFCSCYCSVCNSRG